MTKSFTSKAIAALAFVALASSMLLAPMQASASGVRSLGHGVKCYWAVVSYDPVRQATVLNYVCRQGI
jgi:hypothetical protein